MGMPPRRDLQRLQANADALRALIDAGSPRVVRDNMAGGAVITRRRKYPVPSIGTRSGKITVTGYLCGERGGFNALIVQCDCGFPEYTVEGNNFRTLKSTRCNICAKTAAGQKRYWRYSEALPDDNHRTRLLNRLAAAITRCTTPTCRMYRHYGGRGIRVHQEWIDDRTAFLRYAQTLPGWDVPEYEMDRRDNNGHYEPGNIRFVSRSDNTKNKRKVSDLEEEIARLRRDLRRAEESLHSLDR